MAWFYLIAAGVFEVIWATAMKHSEGFSKLTPSMITVIAMILSFWLLALAMRDIPLGTAYPIWTGVGAVGAFIAGVVLFAEPLHLLRVIAVGCIMLGLLLLKATSPH